MIQRMRRLSLFALGLLACSSAHAQLAPNAHTRVQAQAEQFVDCLRTMQYDKEVDMMHPKLLELAGGHATMVAKVKSAMESAFLKGITIDSMEAGQVEEPVKGGEDWFVRVPRTLRLTGPKAKVEQTTYMVAISSDQGKNWFFVGDGSIRPDIMHKLFPDMPSSVQTVTRPAPIITPLP